ncbi:hypothetical protein FRC90_10435 [Paracidovorax citrulli]|nr:hypothetical protein FRC90_10435 [Paracidovorax citrulli]
MIDRKKILYVLAPILLSIVGAAIWEWAVRPLFAVIGLWALDVATLGLDSLRNAIYEDAAQGLYEKASANTLILLWSVIVAVPGYFISYTMGKNRASKLYGNMSPDDPVLIKTVALHKRVLMVLTALLFIAGFINLILFQRMLYVNRVIGHFNQSFAIAAPAMSEKDRLDIISNFASMKKRGDYIALIDQLAATAERHKKTLPKFSIY